MTSFQSAAELIYQLTHHSPEIYTWFYENRAHNLNALSTRIPLFAGNLPWHRKLLPSNSQLESCVYVPCLQGNLTASCSLQLKSEQTNAAIPILTQARKCIKCQILTHPTPLDLSRHPRVMWPVSPAPVVSSQTILDGKPPTNKSSTQGRNTACGCVPAWLPALNFALVFKTPGIYFKKIQLLFTLRWPLALHDIIPVSCRINLPANPSFTRDIYLILWKPGAQLKCLVH